MEAQEFFSGVARYAAIMVVFAIFSVVVGLAPLLIGWSLGQKRLGIFGFLFTGISFFFAGPLVGGAALLLATIAIVIISLRRRKAAHASVSKAAVVSEK
jgi:hypothetical protein